MDHIRNADTIVAKDPVIYTHVCKKQRRPGLSKTGRGAVHHVNLRIVFSYSYRFSGDHDALLDSKKHGFVVLYPYSDVTV